MPAVQRSRKPEKVTGSCLAQLPGVMELSPSTPAVDDGETIRVTCPNARVPVAATIATLTAPRWSNEIETSSLSSLIL